MGGSVGTFSEIVMFWIGFALPVVVTGRSHERRRVPRTPLNRSRRIGETCARHD